MSNLIYKKMSDVMKEIGFISKDKKNDQQGFKFRGIDQFVNSLYPALTKHGVFMTPRCVKEEHLLKDVVRSSGKAGVDKHVSIMMEYDFFAEDGSKVTAGPVPAEGLDSGDKATNKALSAALKYALIQTFSIPTEDMEEGDSTTLEIASNVEAPRAAKATPAPAVRAVSSVTTVANPPTTSGVTTTVVANVPAAAKPVTASVRPNFKARLAAKPAAPAEDNSGGLG